MIGFKSLQAAVLKPETKYRQQYQQRTVKKKGNRNKMKISTNQTSILVMFLFIFTTVSMRQSLQDQGAYVILLLFVEANKMPCGRSTRRGVHASRRPRVDASTPRRIDVSTRRRIDAWTCRRFDASTRRR